MAKQIKLLGMDRADEKTFALAAALATHAHGLEQTELLKDVRELKKFCKAVPFTTFISGPSEYPESHADFKRDHPEIFAQAFAHEAPTPSKWTTEFRNLIISSAPCRSTKTGIDRMTLNQPSPMIYVGQRSQVVNAVRDVRASLLASATPQRPRLMSGAK